MEPIKYLRRADNNFFGPRTAWYSQLESNIGDEDADLDSLGSDKEGNKSEMDGDVENKDKSMAYDDDGEAEQVSVLDPIAYELRASMNTPNLRTTFYGM